MRTCLFNWAFARHHGGQLVFRIEDTDAARDSEESYQELLEALRWLGMDWDEGPERGGEYGPYRQSERAEIYTDVIAKLRAAGHVYEAYSTNEEVEARHRAADRDPKLGYDNFDRHLTEAQRAAYQSEGREPVLRLRMPDEDISWVDMVRGEVTFPAGSVPDPVLVRANGKPLYTLTNPVDDALMRITHIMRGEDLLPSTPRQIGLYRALTDIGVATVIPTYGHLPLVRGDGNKKLSKRDPQANLWHYRERGFVPEGLINYLALLGWSIGPDRDIFSPAELTAAFDGTGISPNPARFDEKKAEAINAQHIRLLPADDLAGRIETQLTSAGLTYDSEVVKAATPLVAERIVTLSDAVTMLSFLFVSEEEAAPAPEVAAKNLGPDAHPLLAAAVAALEPLASWESGAIEAALSAALIDGLGLKPRKAYTPIRVAISGRTISPPLFESMELLGRDRSLSRLRRAQG
jgi:glutamyl-tRNA synthetase